jgi:transmembrane sensor
MQSMEKDTLYQLYKDYLDGILLPNQWEELKGHLINLNEFEELDQELEKRQNLNDFEKVNPIIFERILQKTLKNESNNPDGIVPPGNKLRFLTMTWFKVAVAVLILTGVTIAYFWPDSSIKKSKISSKSVAPGADLPPGNSKAILTLSDGKKVELNNATVETIKDGNLAIKSNNGHLLYENTHIAVVNTMTTPKGGQYQLSLSDGTKVWLNAASSITYPTLFNSHIREVSITGEVYFEVAANSKIPFAVRVNQQNNIEVLGTSFNINAYSDEPVQRITLISGKVKVNSNGRYEILAPGQQSIATATSIKINANANIEQAVAWKNGIFDFNKVSLEEVLRQISRWYDVDVEYKGNISPKVFGGQLQRDFNLSEVLEVLKETGVHFKLQNRKLIITR